VSPAMNRPYRRRAAIAACLVGLTASAAPAQSITSGSLTLEQALHRAESRSEAIAAAEADGQRARAEPARARSGRLPQLNLSGSYDRARRTPHLWRAIASRRGGHEILDIGWLRSPPPRVSALDLPGRVRKQQEAALSHGPLLDKREPAQSGAGRRHQSAAGRCARAARDEVSGQIEGLVPRVYADSNLDVVSVRGLIDLFSGQVKNGETQRRRSLGTMQ
jgi:hypothetical protein